MKGILETPRLRLRELEPCDFDALCRVLQDPVAMTAYEHAFTDEEVRAWLGRQRERYRAYGFGLWAVQLPGGRRDHRPVRPDHAGAAGRRPG